MLPVGWHKKKSVPGAAQRMNGQMGACGGGGRGAAERQQTAVRRHAMVTERNEGNGGIAGIEPRLGFSTYVRSLIA